MKKSIQHVEKLRDSQLERWHQHLVGHWFCHEQAADPKWFHSSIGLDALA